MYSFEPSDERRKRDSNGRTPSGGMEEDLSQKLVSSGNGRQPRPEFFQAHAGAFQSTSATSENILGSSFTEAEGPKTRYVTQPSFSDAVELLEAHRLMMEQSREFGRKRKLSESAGASGTEEETSHSSGVQAMEVTEEEYQQKESVFQGPSSHALQGPSTSAAKDDIPYVLVEGQLDFSAYAQNIRARGPFYGTGGSIDIGGTEINLDVEGPFFSAFDANRSRIAHLVHMFVHMGEDDSASDLADIHLVMEDKPFETDLTPYECRDSLMMISMILLYNLFMLKDPSELDMTQLNFELTHKLVMRLDEVLEMSEQPRSAITNEDFRLRERIRYALDDLRVFVDYKDRPNELRSQRVEFQMLEEHRIRGQEARWILGCPSDLHLQQDERSSGSGMFYYASVFRYLTWQDSNFLYRLRSMLNAKKSINEYVRLGLNLISNEATSFLETALAQDPSKRKERPGKLPRALFMEIVTFEDLSREVIIIYLSILRMILNKIMEGELEDGVFFTNREFMRVLNTATRTLICNVHSSQYFFVAVMARYESIRNLCEGIFRKGREDIVSGLENLSDLWQKLLSFRHPSEVKNFYVNEKCCICRESRFVDESLFFIFDSCNHVACYSCSETIDKMYKCPECLADLTSYTSFHAYQRYFYGRLKPYDREDLQHSSSLSVRTFSVQEPEPPAYRRYEEGKEDLLVGRPREFPLIPQNVTEQGAQAVPQPEPQEEEPMLPATEAGSFAHPSSQHCESQDDEVKEVFRMLLSSPKRSTKSGAVQSPRKFKIRPLTAISLLSPIMMPEVMTLIQSNSSKPEAASSSGSRGPQAQMSQQGMEKAAEHETSQQTLGQEQKGLRRSPRNLAKKAALSSQAGPSGFMAGPSISQAGPSGFMAGPSGFMAGPSGSQAGPSGSQAGPSGSQAGPSGSQAGPSGSQAGPSGSQAGPSGSQAGPSGSQAGPSDSQAGPSGFMAGPSGSQAGPSGSQAGPSGFMAGPSGFMAGPSGSQAGPSGSQAGPSDSQAGPSGAVAGPSGLQNLSNPNTQVTLGSLSKMLPPRSRVPRRREREGARQRASVEARQLRSLLQGNEPNYPRYGRPDRVIAREYQKNPQT